MSAPVRVSGEAASAQANALGRLLSGGYLELRTGAQPAKPESPATGVMLAKLFFDDPATLPADGGLLVLHPLVPEQSAEADGDAGWFRAYGSDGRPVCDGSVGTKDATLILGSTHIQQGSRVVVQAGTFIVQRA